MEAKVASTNAICDLAEKYGGSPHIDGVHGVGFRPAEAPAVAPRTGRRDRYRYRGSTLPQAYG